MPRQSAKSLQGAPASTPGPPRARPRGSDTVAWPELADPEVPAPVWAAGDPALAVTLHDIEPRTFGRVREIREWLTQRGVVRLTLAVIPAADLHPVGTRAPLLASWLRAQVARGDAVAQHGLQHRGGGPEFANLDREESRGRVQAGLTMLRDIELDPRGFIAPAYAYTPALRQVLCERFDWFAEHARVRGGLTTLTAPTLRLGTSSPMVTLLAPTVTRARAPFCGAVMRLDIHPGDFDRPGHIATIDTLLHRAAHRQVITYDDVFASTQ